MKKYVFPVLLVLLAATNAHAAITIDTADILTDIGTISTAIVAIGTAWMAVKFASSFLRRVRLLGDQLGIRGRNRSSRSVLGWSPISSIIFR